MGSENYLPPIKPKRVSCLCCGSSQACLPFDTVLYSGFGGWMINRNGQGFFLDDSNKEWEEFKTLAFIEEQAAKDPDADWVAICDTPLHGEKYQRQNGKWVLVEENDGFA